MLFHNGELHDYILDLAEDKLPEDMHLDAHYYMRQTSVRAALGLPIWGPRAAEAISIHHVRALVYIRKEALPEEWDESYDVHNDWGFMVNEHLVMQYDDHEHHDPDMIMIDTDIDFKSHENMLYPSLVAAMPNLTKDDLPNFFVLNVHDWNALEYDRFWKGHTDKELEYVAYTEPLGDVDGL